jgi:hypothetical protein
VGLEPEKFFFQDVPADRDPELFPEPRLQLLSDKGSIRARFTFLELFVGKSEEVADRR